MPDKLTKQDVYVPMDSDRELPDALYNFALIPVAYKLPGVYVLTGKELADLLTEYEESLHGNSISFLKEKGVEI